MCLDREAVRVAEIDQLAVLLLDDDGMHATPSVDHNHERGSGVVVLRKVVSQDQ
jgi:hypothetical protein